MRHLIFFIKIITLTSILHSCATDKQKEKKQETQEEELVLASGFDHINHLTCAILDSNIILRNTNKNTTIAYFHLPKSDSTHLVDTTFFSNYYLIKEFVFDTENIVSISYATFYENNDSVSTDCSNVLTFLKEKLGDAETFSTNKSLMWKKNKTKYAFSIFADGYSFYININHF